MPNSPPAPSLADVPRLLKETANHLEAADRHQAEAEMRIEALKKLLPPGDPALLALMNGRPPTDFNGR